ncbi:hypothetical protein EJ08DRAFT_94995 [Tothia fuscella]|uniref:Uncharacterized protein n=1 Tax=Tothia fuscella TaxID=1048955 RepID=A0A9P4U1R9_9PEZI|nr:hypothetical protein EJ08DRAFT_94995 [Tothia fuscella]
MVSEISCGSDADDVDGEGQEGEDEVDDKDEAPDEAAASNAESFSVNIPPFTTVENWLDTIEHRLKSVQTTTLNQLSILLHDNECKSTGFHAKSQIQRRFERSLNIDEQAITELRLQRWNQNMYAKKYAKERAENKARIERLELELQISQKEVEHLKEKNANATRNMFDPGLVKSGMKRQRALRDVTGEMSDSPNKLPKLIGGAEMENRESIENAETEMPKMTEDAETETPKALEGTGMGRPK